MRRALLFLLLIFPVLARAEMVRDATGRSVEVPAHVARVLPAGPPAAVLMLAIAPDLMIGLPFSVSPEARPLLSDPAAALLKIPRLTGKDDATDAIKALKPDLILDYGTVSPRFSALAAAMQEKTGIPTILLDGALTDTPRVLRQLGAILHREQRAESLAVMAEALLKVAPPTGKTPTVVYARGPDGLTVVAPDTGASEVFTRLGWKVLAPAGDGWFRPSDVAAIGALDPDILVFADPAMRAILAHSDAWRGLRAVREGHVFVAPILPFSWIEDPPSLNRLLGLAWLQGRDPGALATEFNAAFYGRALTPAQVQTIVSPVYP